MLLPTVGWAEELPFENVLSAPFLMSSANLLDWSNLCFVEYFLLTILHKENFHFPMIFVTEREPCLCPASWPLPLVHLWRSYLGSWFVDAIPPLAHRMPGCTTTRKTCFFGADSEGAVWLPLEMTCGILGHSQRLPIQ